MERTYHIDGSAPQAGQIFVFGSNLSGHHYGGAAAAAFRHHGAQWGIGEGATGNSYAIPTMTVALSDALELEDIRSAVDRFIAYAIANSDKQFFVTRIGCGIAGYRNEQVAPFFARAPVNCSLPDAWRATIEQVYDRIRKENEVAAEQRGAQA